MQSAQKPQHIIFMMLDDVGHYNLGYMGNQEFRTPNMDGLVKEGIQLDRHYVYKYCSPTRTSFLSGRLPVHMSEKMAELPDVYGIDVRATTVAAKLSQQGYATHQIGKWHAGSALEGQLPMHKGFDTSFGYLSGEEDHYTQMEQGFIDFWDTDKPAYGKNGIQYGAFNFEQRAVSIIKAHDISKPLFMYLAWQEAHTPNQVPEEFESSSISFPLKRTYEGMLHILDSGVGNVTDALKARGMWENTLLVVSSDNGGRVDGQFGGNNYPLRGQKFTDFEGGVRVAAFASGGVIPKARRGQKETGLIHVADWLATFCKLAGCAANDPAAQSSRVPDTDSLDQTETLFSGAVSPRQHKPLPISSDALIVWPYKLVLGNQKHRGYWTQPNHPNSTAGQEDTGKECPRAGCLFNIETDPTEHNDLSGKMKQELSKLSKTLKQLEKGFYQSKVDPKRGAEGYTECSSQEDWAKAHKNFAGPVCWSAKNEGSSVIFGDVSYV